MNEIAEKRLQCPYCGERISMLFDTSVPEQDYIEDCEVCCRPILLAVRVNNGVLSVSARSENE